MSIVNTILILYNKIYWKCNYKYTTLTAIANNTLLYIIHSIHTKRYLNLLRMLLITAIIFRLTLYCLLFSVYYR
jgi:hypothetical protein